MGILPTENGSKVAVFAYPGESAFAADFASPNHLLFRQGSALFAQPLNLQSRQLEGEAVRIADPVGSLTTLGRPGFSVSHTGVLAFWPLAPAAEGADLVVYERRGKLLAALGAAVYRGVDVSPDGTRVVTELHDDSGGSDVRVLDLERNTRQRGH
jgi:hypothetical protein